MAHIYVHKLPIFGSDGLSPGRHQIIIWISAGILLIGALGTNFSEIFIEIYIFSFKKCLWKLCPGLNVLSDSCCISLLFGEEFSTDFLRLMMLLNFAQVLPITFPFKWFFINQFLLLYYIDIVLTQKWYFKETHLSTISFRLGCATK